MNYYETDPEFIERFERFAFDEVIKEEGQQLDDSTRYIAILAILVGCQGIDAYKEILPQALERGLSPVAVKEIVYQSVDYLGMGRMWPFLKVMHEILTKRGVNLPLEGQATTTMEDRLEKGIQVRKEIFGEPIKEDWKPSHIDRWLSANCFGDYYTRTGLTLAEREMVTFCFLAAQGGCETQLVSHVKGNRNVGNDKAFLMKVVSQCLPYIGYPRSLNVIICINKVYEL